MPSVNFPELDFSSRLLQPREDLTLPDRPALLHGHRWTKIVASQTFDASQFMPLLTELKREHQQDDCNHFNEIVDISDGEAALKTLLRDDSIKSAIFYYYGIEASGGRVLVAVGAVSDRIGHSFTADGFPVLSRCFIRPQYRHQGLYGLITAHRVTLCFEIWGPYLKAIYIGTAQQAVKAFFEAREFRKRHFLPVEMETRTIMEGHAAPIEGPSIMDYLYFTESYASLLMRSGTDLRAPLTKSIVHLRGLLCLLVTVGFYGCEFVEVLHLLEQIKSETGWSLAELNPELCHFIALGKTIPLLEKRGHGMTLATSQPRAAA